MYDVFIALRRRTSPYVGSLVPLGLDVLEVREEELDIHMRAIPVKVCCGVFRLCFASAWAKNKNGKVRGGKSQVSLWKG